MSLKEFVKIAVALREHPKILQAGDEGGWFYVCAIMWSKEHDTDGFIPEYAVDRLTGLKQPKRVLRRCLDANLFEVSENGFRIHDYLEVQEPSEKRRAAGKKAADARWEAERAMRIASESHTDRNATAMRNRNTEEEEEEEKTPLTPQAPPGGNRKTDIAKWEDDIVAWADSVGVRGPRQAVLKAVRQHCPWQTRPGEPTFLWFCHRHFPTLVGYDRPAPTRPEVAA